MEVRNVSSMGYVRPSFKANDGKTTTNLLMKDAPADSAEFLHKADKQELSKADKQEIIRSARTTASGWGIFGGIFSTLYFGLRSDNTVANKYDLDTQKDKDLIKQIKREQTMWTLASMIPGIGCLGGIVAYIYNKNADASKIEVK